MAAPMPRSSSRLPSLSSLGSMRPPGFFSPEGFALRSGMGTAPVPVNPINLTGGLGDFGRELLGGVGDAIRGGIQDRIAGFFNPGGGSGSGALSAEGMGGSGCPTGYTWNPTIGECIEVGGNGSTGVSIAPGSGYGAAVMGSFGIPALQPAQVGEVRNSRGGISPILRCPPGAVLGKDNLCYMKGSIPRQYRKWKPKPKPVMSAADAKALRRIGTLQKKVTRLAGSAGLTCRKRR